MDRTDLWLDKEWCKFYREEIKPKKDNEYDMLVGNMNRMCVCDDEKELEMQFDNAVNRLYKLKEINSLRITKGLEILERLKTKEEDLIQQVIEKPPIVQKVINEMIKKYKR